VQLSHEQPRPLKAHPPEVPIVAQDCPPIFEQLLQEPAEQVQVQKLLILLALALYIVNVVVGPLALRNPEQLRPGLLVQLA